ncbi:unnamed protein product [Orchesella dallaii]|uniref:Uncharacterized protein n=1 Tax=Orchesella dallaii TaxID=48710 RepID=A0ABP1PUK9_9HEXA
MLNIEGTDGQESYDAHSVLVSTVSSRVFHGSILVYLGEPNTLVLTPVISKILLNVVARTAQGLDAGGGDLATDDSPNLFWFRKKGWDKNVKELCREKYQVSS